MTKKGFYWSYRQTASQDLSSVFAKVLDGGSSLSIVGLDSCEVGYVLSWRNWTESLGAEVFHCDPFSGQDLWQTLRGWVIVLTTSQYLDAPFCLVPGERVLTTVSDRDEPSGLGMI